MNNFKKGLSLIAVIAFLITALIPMAAFAQTNSDVQPQPSTSTPPAPVSPWTVSDVRQDNKIYGTSTDVLAFQGLNADLTNVGVRTQAIIGTDIPVYRADGSINGSDFVNVYMWGSTTAQYKLNFPAELTSPPGVTLTDAYTTWYLYAPTTVGSSISTGTDPNLNAVSFDSNQYTADAVTGYLKPSSAGGKGRAYCFAIGQLTGTANINGTDTTVNYYTPAYSIIPVQAMVQVDKTANLTTTTSPATYSAQWSTNGQSLTATWEAWNPATSEKIDGLGNLVVQQMQTAAVTPALAWSATRGADNIDGIPSEPTFSNFSAKNTVDVNTLTNTAATYTVTAQSALIQSSNTAWAGFSWRDEAGFSDPTWSGAPIGSWGATTTLPLNVTINLTAIPVEALTESSTQQEQTLISPGDTEFTVWATKGAIKTLKATKPVGSAGLWTIGDKTYSEYNTKDVNLAPGSLIGGDAKVVDFATMSTLYYVMPNVSTEQTVSYKAASYIRTTDDGNEQGVAPSGQTVTTQWPAAAIAAAADGVSAPANSNAVIGTNVLTIKVIPTTQDPDIAKVIVTPGGQVVAKGDDADFTIELAPSGGLSITSVTATLTPFDNELGTWGGQSIHAQLTKKADDTNTVWTLPVETKYQLPVGVYRVTFDVKAGLTTSSTTTYTFTSEPVILQVVQLLGREGYEWTEAGWSTNVPVRAAASQTLQLNNQWWNSYNYWNGTVATGTAKWSFAEPASNVASYRWSVAAAAGSPSGAVTPLSDDSMDATFTVPQDAKPGNSWTITCTPYDTNGIAMPKISVSYNVNAVAADPKPVITGYTYAVSPKASVFPHELTWQSENGGVLSAMTVAAGRSSAWNIPWGMSGAAFMSGATVKITADLDLQNDPSAMNFQWMVNTGAGWAELREGPNVSGVTTQVLTIGASADTKDWQLRCVVTNKNNAAYKYDEAGQSVTMKVRTPGAVDLNAKPLPMITSNPATGTNPVQNPTNVTTVTVSTGMTVTFTAQDMNVTDGAPAPLPSSVLKYQWKSAPSASGTFTDIEGATGETYSVVATQENSGTVYQCHVINTYSQGEKTGDSNKIRLNVKAPDGSVWFTEPATTPNPFNRRPGQTVTLKASARSDNGDEVTYQWQVAPISKNMTIEQVLPGAWTNVTGATSAELTTAPLTNGYYFYRCIATNAKDAGKRATSLPFRVNVTSLSNIPVVTPSHFVSGSSETVQYVAIGAEAGSSVTFEVKGKPDTNDPVIYIWKAIEPTGTPENPGSFQDPTNAANTTILAQGSDGVLTIDVPQAYNGYSFVCQVQNAADPQAYAYSAVWNLTVWPEGTVPQIIEEPQDITATYPAAYSDTQSEDRQTEMAVQLPMPGIGAVVNDVAQTGSTIQLQQLNGGIWTAVSQPKTMCLMPETIGAAAGTLAQSGTPALTIKSDNDTRATYKAEAILSNDAYLANGTYRLALTGYAPENAEWNGAVNTVTNSNPVLPTVYSDPFEVKITVIGQPMIKKQPDGQRVTLGETATFSVEAEVEPATTVLTYRWQISTDNGDTWTNCLEKDGTGAGTPTFTTAATTAEMQNNQPILYRCVVQNLNSQQSITSDAAQLLIEDAAQAPAVALAPADGSNVAISEVDGVKYLSGTGLSVTKDGTPVSAVIAMLQRPEGYAMKVVDSEGTEKAQDAIVGTCDKIQLVNSSTNAVADEAVIVVRGDVLGTGQMSLTQLVRMAEAYKGTVTLEGAALMAGDLTGTGSISLTDLVQEATIYKAEMMDSTEPIPSQEPAE